MEAPVPEPLARYVDRFQRLHVATRGEHASPHKPCMLLAVIDLAEAGALEINRIDYSPALLERYTAYFECVGDKTDHANPYFPFFHLRGDRFWRLIAKPGREAVLDAMRTARSHRDISENVDHVELDEDLHRLLCDAQSREVLRRSLVARWFGDNARILAPLLEQSRRENLYEHELRDGSKVAEPTLEAVRGSAFRRLVLEVYDYRCAASGWRLIVPGGTALVDAAHLIPFSESHNDDPRNGIALTPTFHRALDQNLIAPGPDLKWHVSAVFDDRLPENQPLISLRGRTVLLPDTKYRPLTHALVWRLHNLRTA